MRVILFNLYPYRVLRETRRKRRFMAELTVGVVLGLGACYAIGETAGLPLTFPSHEAAPAYSYSFSPQRS